MANKRAETDRGLTAWAMLLRAHAALVSILEREVEEATGLPLSWYDVLLELNQAPERRLRMTVLGERVVLSRSRVSRIVDEMAAAGYVVRRPDPTDGRSTLAVLNATGRTALRRAAPIYLDGIRRHFSSHLSRSEADCIISGLSRVLEASSEDEEPLLRRGNQ